jgi:hypothetical protein
MIFTNRVIRPPRKTLAKSHSLTKYVLILSSQLRLGLVNDRLNQILTTNSTTALQII